MEKFLYIINMRRYNLKEDYFDKIDTEEKAYFLGLLASDGCVTDEDKVLISLQEKDSYILDELKSKLEYGGPIYEIKPRLTTHQPQRRLQFKSSRMSASLTNLGIYPRKSLKLKFPKIDEQLVSHFIRGYFDGDGSVRVSKDVLVYKFVGTFEFLDRLQNILIQNCDLPKTKMFQANKDRNTWELSYSGDKQCIRIYNYLYNNSTVYLKRKKDKVTEQIGRRLSLYSSWILDEQLEIRKRA